MEEIVLTAITRAYEDWTFYSDSEKYLSSASTEEQQQDNKAAETLDLPSAPSESPAAPEESNTVQTKANTSPPIAKEASEMGEASDARQTNQEDEFGGLNSAKETKELSPEARQVRTELKSTQPLASTGEDGFFPPTSRENKNISKREAREVDTELKSTQPSASNTERNSSRRRAPYAMPPATLGEKWLGSTTQNQHDDNSPARTQSKTMTTEREAGVASTNNHSPKTGMQAGRAGDQAKRRESLDLPKARAPQPRANSTGPSEQAARAPAKKHRPRVKRTANASSWADWGVSNQPPDDKEHFRIVRS